MFILRWSPEARAQYDALKSIAGQGQSGKKKTGRQAGLFKQVCKALKYLQTNPRHPGLRTHKYESVNDPTGQNRELFEAYVQNQTPGAYRIFWYYSPGKGEMTIVAITPHP